MPGPPGNRKRINYALGATLIIGGMSYDEAAAQCNAKNGESLRCGLSQRGVTQATVRNLPLSMERNAPVVARIARQAFDSLRNRMGTTLGKHVDGLAKVPVRANLSHLQKVANVIEPMTRAASRIEGWEAQEKAALIQVEHMSTMREVQTCVVSPDPSRESTPQSVITPQLDQPKLTSD